MKTAILIDGGFYRKRASKLWAIKLRKRVPMSYIISACENSIKKRKN